MRIRSVELIAEGSSLGDDLSIRISDPQERIHINSPTRFTILISSEKGAEKIRSLEFEKGDGMEAAQDSWRGKKQEDGSMEFNLNLIPRGEKGPSLLKFLIKGERFKATLAMEDVEILARPPLLDVIVPEAPVKWNGRESIDIEYFISVSGKMSSKVRSRFRFLDRTGKVVRESPYQRIDPNDRRGRIIRIDPADHVSSDELVGQFQFDVDGDKQERLIDPIIRMDKDNKFDLRFPGVVSPLSVMEIELRTNGEETINTIRARLDDQELINKREIEVSDASVKAFFRVPEMESGDHSLTIFVNDRIGSASVIRVEQDDEPMRIMVESEPFMVVPGGTTKLIIDISPSGSGDIKAILEPDAEYMGKIDLGMIGPHGHLEKEVEIPTEIRGDLGGRITLFKGDNLIITDVFTRILSVRSEKSVPVNVKIPIDREKTDPDDISGYLFLGEVPSQRVEYSDIGLITTNLGRSLVEKQSKLLPQSEKDIEQASMVIIQECFIEALSSHDMIQNLTRVLLMVESMDSIVPGEINRGDLTKEAGFTGALARAFYEGSTDPALNIHSKDERDPLCTLSLLLREVTGNQGVCISGDPVGSLDSCVERIITEIKGREVQIDRNIAAFVMSEISRRGISAIREMERISKDKIRNSEKTTRTLRILLFYLISYSLVRIEIMSRWSDPVVSLWEEIRITRQRSIKSAVQTSMETIKAISDIHNAALQRWNGYMNNLKKRRRMRSMGMMDIKMIPGKLSGLAGKTWSMHLVISLPRDTVPLRIIPYISFPRGGWSLEYPRSLRDGNRLILDTINIGPQEKREMELRIGSPASVRDSDEIMIYLYPDGLELEEEP